MPPDVPSPPSPGPALPDAASDLRTFLIADVRGYTRFTQEHGDEAAAQLAERFAVLAREGVEARGGQLLELRGDEALAVFGSARQALRAALDLQARFAAVTEADPELPLRVGIGLDAGEAVPVEGGYRGGALNLAARLCSLAGPGEVFASEWVVHLARTVEGLTYVDRGQVQLKGFTVPVRVIQIALEGQLPSTLPPLQQILVTHSHNLPAQPTTFIGREREIAAVAELLGRPAVRLLTLTGPGGTGKTRLALQVAGSLLAHFADGVFFVSLAPISDPGLVASTVAGVLGIKESGGHPLEETLHDYLRTKQVLLVLDNFEHLLAAARLVVQLLAAAPRLKVLVTSRAVLRVQGEHEHVVPPLAVPDPRHLPPLDALSQYDAVRLFIERAQAVKADFAVTNETAPAVAELCVRLDGLPLAIELAAARIRLLPPQALLARLGSRLKLLTGGARDLPARQQTLRAAIDWSYSLLNEVEKTLFARLTVFAGGCTLEAIEAICNSDGQLDVLEGVESLIEKSLLRQEEGLEGEPRFVMLETIREYALEQLIASGEAADLQWQHATYYLALSEEAEPELHGPRLAAWLDRLEHEQANLRAAVRRAVETGQVDPGLRACAALWLYWPMRGHVAEAREWLAALLAAPEAAHVTTARARALFAAGMLAWHQGDHAAARALHEESLAIQRQLGDRAGMAAALFGLGQVALGEGGYAAARSLHEESLAIRRELGDRWQIGFSLTNMGIVAVGQGDYILARSLFQEGLALRREAGDRRGVAVVLLSLADVATEQDDYDRANALCQQSLAIARELGDRYIVAQALAGLAAVAGARSQLERALRLAGAAEALLDTMGVSYFPGWQRRFERRLEQIRQAKEQGTGAAAWAEGKAMSMKQTITYALREESVLCAEKSVPRAGASPPGSATGAR